MVLLSESDRLTATNALANLPHPVQLLFFEQTIGCETCGPTRRILAQIAELSPQVRIEALNCVLDCHKAAEYRIERVPAIVVVGRGASRIRFYGAPLGHEVASLIEAVCLVSSGDPGLSADSLAQIQVVNQPVDIQVFVTATCAQCPRMTSLAVRLAVAHPEISATCIAATEYPDLVRRYRVNGVPKTIVNDRVEILGPLAEQDFVREIRQAAMPSV